MIFCTCYILYTHCIITWELTDQNKGPFSHEIVLSVLISVSVLMALMGVPTLETEPLEAFLCSHCPAAPSVVSIQHVTVFGSMCLM